VRGGRANLRQGLREARRRNSAAGVAEALSVRAHSRYSRGLIGDALADAGAALDAAGAPLGVWPPPAYLLALCHIERGALEQAATALRLPTPAPEDPRHAFDRAAQGQLALAREDFDAARAAFLAAGAAIEPVTSNPAVLRWQSGAALASARLADRKRARMLVAGELRAAREFGARRPVGVALRTAGVIVGGKEGAILLREAVATLERSPSRLEQAHALVDLGMTLRRLGLRIEARERLRHGIELAETCGAVALARRGHEERSPPERGRGVARSAGPARSRQANGVWSSSRPDRSRTARSRTRCS
jgi:tetratricopeptide (TPR) repeat protein